jgi:hypothetical protein
MPRLCEPCRFHSADDSLSACPECAGPVKFTLLPPTNEAPPPVDLGRHAPTPPKPVGASDFFRGKMLWVTAGVVAALFAAVVAVFLLREEPFGQRVAKIKPGMSMTEVLRIMDDSNQAKKTRKVGFTVGANGVQEFDERTVDSSMVTDVWDADGWVEYAEGFEGVRIEYSRNVVTRVTPIKPDRTKGGWREYN